MSINLITVAGRMATDPTTNVVNNISCTSFSLASDSKLKDANGNYITNFYRVTAWRNLGDNAAKYLHKGDAVTITGDVGIREYTDKNGQSRTAVQITANQIEYPPRKKDAAASAPAPAAQDAPPDDDELPF